MKMRSLTQLLSAGAISLTSVMVGIQPSHAQASFVCEFSSTTNLYTTYAQTPRGPVPVVRWLKIVTRSCHAPSNDSKKRIFCTKWRASATTVTNPGTTVSTVKSFFLYNKEKPTQMTAETMIASNEMQAPRKYNRASKGMSSRRGPTRKRRRKINKIVHFTRSSYRNLWILSAQATK